MSSYNNVFSPFLVTSPFPQLLNLTLSANASLIWPTAYQNTGNVVSQLIYVSPTSNGFTLTLPQVAIAASGPVPAQPFVGTGELFFIGNPTAFSFTVSTYAGGQTFTINSGNFIVMYLLQNTTPDGVWGTGFTSNVTAVTSIGFAIASDVLGNLTVSSSSTNPITNSGTFTLDIANDFLGIITAANTGSGLGLMARTAANTWALRSIAGTANQIDVANGNGVSGSPTLSLNSTITGINSLTAGNIVLSGNTISTNNSTHITITPPVADKEVEIVGNILLDFNTGNQSYATIYTGTAGKSSIVAGNQSVDINYVLPTTLPALNQLLGASTASNPIQLQWYSVPTFPGSSTLNAIAKYANTSGSLANSGVIIDGSNNVSGALSYKAANIQIGDPGAVFNNTIFSTNTDGPIIFLPNGTGEVVSSTNLDLSNGSKIKLFPLGQSYTSSVFLSLIAPAGLVSQLNLQLPAVDATYTNAPIVSNTAGVLSFNNQAILQTTVSMTAAQIDGMFTTGFPIIPAIAGNIIVILNAEFVYTYTTVFTGGGAIQLQYANTGNNGGVNTLTSTIAATFLTNANSSIYKYSGADLVGATAKTNVGIYLTNGTALFAGGPVSGNTLAITVYYVVIPGTV